MNTAYAELCQGAKEWYLWSRGCTFHNISLVIPSPANKFQRVQVHGHDLNEHQGGLCIHRVERDTYNMKPETAATLVKPLELSLISKTMETSSW